MDCHIGSCLTRAASICNQLASSLSLHLMHLTPAPWCRARDKWPGLPYSAPEAFPVRPGDPGGGVDTSTTTAIVASAASSYSTQDCSLLSKSTSSSAVRSRRKTTGNFDFLIGYNPAGFNPVPSFILQHFLLSFAVDTHPALMVGNCNCGTAPDSGKNYNF